MFVRPTSTPSRQRRLVGLATLVGAALIGTLLAVPAQAAPVSSPTPVPSAAAPGTYVPVEPTVLLDTRTTNGGHLGRVAARAQFALPVLGRGGIPAHSSTAPDVSAISITLMAIAPAGSGGFTVWKNGVARPNTINLAFAAGPTAATQAVTQIGADGAIGLGNESSGAADMAVIVNGYWLGGTPTVTGATSLVTPTRLLDTRLGVGAPKKAVPKAGSVAVTVGGHAGVPTNAQAVLVDVTAMNSTSTGNIIAYGNGFNLPGTASLSYVTNRPVTNLVEVRLGTGGAIRLYNSSAGSVQLTADVIGYIVPGSSVINGASYAPTPTSVRMLDTRSGLGAPKTPIARGGSIAVQMADRGGVPINNVAAVVLNVTAISPAAAGGIIGWADGDSKQTHNAMAFYPGAAMGGLLTIPVGPDGKVVLANNSTAALNLLADVVGYYRADTQPVQASIGHYVRNLHGSPDTVNGTLPVPAPELAEDVAMMNSEGCADAQHDLVGRPHVVLLQFGAQYSHSNVWGVQLSVVNTLVPNTALVADVNGYIAGYARCRATPAFATYILVGTNNDNHINAAVRGTAGGTNWATQVVHNIAANSNQYGDFIVAGANDIEQEFFGTEAEAEAWTRAYVAGTSAPYVFNGSADGCPTNGTGGVCRTEHATWTQAQYFQLAHGISPSRTFALPQIYTTTLAAQWRYISQTGASGPNRIAFLGALTEYAACQQAGDCTSLTAGAGWSALRSQVGGVTTATVMRLPAVTDLKIDNLPDAPASARKATSASL